jgi:hypothetical protein
MDHHDRRSEQAPRAPEIRRPKNAIKDLTPVRAAEEAAGGYAIKLVGIKLV